MLMIVRVDPLRRDAFGFCDKSRCLFLRDYVDCVELRDDVSFLGARLAHDSGELLSGSADPESMSACIEVMVRRLLPPLSSSASLNDARSEDSLLETLLSSQFSSLIGMNYWT